MKVFRKTTVQELDHEKVKLKVVLVCHSFSLLFHHILFFSLHCSAFLVVSPFRSI
jgi:hypothetical protein